MPWVLTPENINAFNRPQSEDPETEWNFDSVPMQDDDLIAIGANLEPGTLIQAYRHGLFPMPMDRKKLGWWSPVTRGIIPLDAVHISRSLQKNLTQFSVRVDTCFTDVMQACGSSARPHGWINTEFIDAYTLLHRSGWANSVEVFLDEQLVGGIYGVRIGRLFAGESMFHTHTDASKTALVALAALLDAAGVVLFDVQWTTEHLKSLGAVDITRDSYLRLLKEAQKSPILRQTETHG